MQSNATSAVVNLPATSSVVRIKRLRYVKPENCLPRMACRKCGAQRRVATGFRHYLKRGKDYTKKVCKYCERELALARWRQAHPGCLPVRIRNGIRRDMAEINKRADYYLRSGVYGISLAYREWVGSRRSTI